MTDVTRKKPGQSCLTNGVRAAYGPDVSSRNPFQAPEVKSRRGGPAKQPLSRDVIVRATLDLLMREGIENVSLRKVATALDTGPASLYAYVEDLEELHMLVFDRALAAVDTVGDPSLDWRTRLHALLFSYFTVLTRGHGLAQLALSMIGTGPNALRVLEALLGLFEEAGVDAVTAPWGIDLVLLYTTAQAAELSHRHRHSHQLIGTVSRALETLDADKFPRVHAARDAMLSGVGPERFFWAIDAIITGCLQKRVTTDDLTPLFQVAKQKLRNKLRAK
jgi:AcrR family transcriptional regulator